MIYLIVALIGLYYFIHSRGWLPWAAKCNFCGRNHVGETTREANYTREELIKEYQLRGKTSCTD